MTLAELRALVAASPDAVIKLRAAEYMNLVDLVIVLNRAGLEMRGQLESARVFQAAVQATDGATP